ncbi:hypothetical protein AB0F81_25535 [Actinoplanes sp. NPDC024001]|uniref:DUF4760 domain-containing protein n=1 Tax=Actinoplanes sp. NPDC024001 TaxID=3154598 RepID=UPI00340D7E65
MRSANHLPVAIELITRDMGLAEFWNQEQLLVSGLADVSPDTPVSELPDPLRSAAYSIASCYDSMGILVAFGCIEERLVVATTNFRIRRMWRALEPHIHAEREARQGLFMDFFEDLACRANAHDPMALHHELRLRSMPRTAANDLAPSRPAS